MLDIYWFFFNSNYFFYYENKISFITMKSKGIHVVFVTNCFTVLRVRRDSLNVGRNGELFSVKAIRTKVGQDPAIVVERFRMLHDFLLVGLFQFI